MNRRKGGTIRGWGEFLIIPVAICIVIVLFFGVIFMLCYLPAIPDVNIFNKEYGTSYTAVQWMCSSNTIKEIIQGTKHNLNILGEEKL